MPKARTGPKARAQVSIRRYPPRLTGAVMVPRRAPSASSATAVWVCLCVTDSLTVVGRDTPAFPPRSVAITVQMPDQFAGDTVPSDNRMSYVDDMITGWL